MTFSSKYCWIFPKRCRNSCILYSLQYLQDLGVPCDNHYRNYILPLGLLYDHDAGDNRYLCKWSSRQTPQTRHSNSSEAHEDKEAQKRAICGGINLWKPFALSLKEKHQIVAGTRNNRHNPFPGHLWSHGCSLWTRKFSLCAYMKFYRGQDKETLDGGKTLFAVMPLRCRNEMRFPWSTQSLWERWFCCPPKFKLIPFNKSLQWSW